MVIYIPHNRFDFKLLRLEFSLNSLVDKGNCECILA